MNFISGNFANVAANVANISNVANVANNNNVATQPKNVTQPNNNNNNNNNDGNIAGGFNMPNSAYVNLSKLNDKTNPVNPAKDTEKTIIEKNIFKNNLNIKNQRYEQEKREALATIQKHLLLNGTNELRFEKDIKSGKELLKVIDISNNDEVVRQIPSEIALHISKALGELEKIQEAIMVASLPKPPEEPLSQ